MATITGTANPDLITGTTKSDVISAGAGDDTVSAGAGNDTVYGGAGADIIDGGDGNDYLYGEDGNDKLSGGDGNDYVDGGSGDDSISGGEGNDSLYGGDGNDTIDGGAGNDTISAGSGDDRIFLSEGTDIVDGGLGNDTLDASRLASGVTVNLLLGTASSNGVLSLLSGIENVVGTTSADNITGDLGDNVLVGNGGNDRIFGGFGADTIVAGNGQGQYFGEFGNDTLVWAVGTTGSQVFDGGSGTDTLRVEMTAAQLTPAVLAELNAYNAFISNPATAGQSYQFSAIGSLLVKGTEGLTVVVDGTVRSLASLANHAPTFSSSGSSQLSVVHGHNVSSSVSAIDSDGDRLTYTIASNAQHGSVTIDSSTGSYVYTAGDQTGADSFTVRVSDGRGGVADKVVNVNITNTGPVIATSSDAAKTVVHGQAVSGAVTATDADGDRLSYAVSTNAQHGSVTIDSSTGSYVYTAGDQTGADSFTVRVSDGHGGVADKVVNINITNTGPVIATTSDAAKTVVHGQAVSGAVTATDADGDRLSYAVSTNAQHGSVTIDSSTGSYVYTAGDQTGADSFTVRVSDGHGGVADKVVNVNITNTGPVIATSSDAHLSVVHGQSVSGTVNATDADGDHLSYAVTGAAEHGSVSIDAATGKFVYAASAYRGQDNFTVSVSDGHGGVAEHAVTVDLTNTAPQIAATSTASLSVAHGASVQGHVDASDADGDNYAFTISSGPQHGTLVFTDGTGSYIYKADDYVGSDSFTVRVADGFGGFAEHEVRVNSNNTGPVINTAASSPFFATNYDSGYSGVVSATDADGDRITYALKTGSAHGTVVVSADGHFVFTAQDYAGPDSFVVTASDGHGGNADYRVDFGVYGTLDASAASSAVSVNLGTGASSGVDAAKVPWAINITGSNYNDVLYGDARNNILFGGAGKDELHGAAGNDRIEGGVGDDKLFGEDGNDILYGGDGNDSLNGGAHNDELHGGAGNDGFFGGGGNDIIYGDAGDDRIYGDGGDDIIRGGAGNDTMTGAGINNTGARGANTYVWERADVLNPDGSKAGLDHITDFGSGDRLDFSGLVSNHAAATHDVVRVTDTASGLVVAVDTGGTSGFVDVVVLDNVHGLTVDDLAHTGSIAV